VARPNADLAIESLQRPTFTVCHIIDKRVVVIQTVPGDFQADSHHATAGAAGDGHQRTSELQADLKLVGSVQAD